MTDGEASIGDIVLVTSFNLRFYWYSLVGVFSIGHEGDVIVMELSLNVGTENMSSSVARFWVSVIGLIILYFLSIHHIWQFLASISLQFEEHRQKLDPE